MSRQPWFLFALITVLAWGVWGAMIDAPARAGFPETLGFVVWAGTMLVPGAVALWRLRGRLEHDLRSVLLGGSIGLLGAGGQLVLFKALRLAPAYLVFPFVALAPVVTILLALALAGERASRRGWLGIGLSLVAAALLSYAPAQGRGPAGMAWMGLALVVFLGWGVQGFIISRANRSMRAESIFCYMALAGLLLAPVGWAMTDFSQPIHLGFRGPWLAALVQGLNAVGALLLVFAFRHGPAILVAPMINAGAPVVTILLSLALARTLPNGPNGAGIVAALAATLLMAMEGGRPD